MSDDCDETVVTAARSLYALSDGLPLILSSLSLFIRQRDSTLTEAVQVFKLSHDLLSLTDEIDSENAILRKVWSLNLSQVGSSETQLLEILAILDPDAIPESLVLGIFDNSQVEARNLVLLDALRKLRPFSFVQRSKGYLSIHRLVQEVLIDIMSPEKFAIAFNLALRLIEDVFPRQSEEGLLMSEHWERCSEYFAHVISLELRFRQHHFQLEIPLQFAQVLYDCAWYVRFVSSSGLNDELTKIYKVPL